MSIGYIVYYVCTVLVLLVDNVCSSLQVSELKQLNRLISDQEVFGLRTIRVPVKRYGVVEELIRAEMEEEQSNVKLGSCIRIHVFFM